MSSAYMFTDDTISDGRLFIKIKKSVGPSREPCGTPALILWTSEVCPLMTTFNDLFERKDSITPRTLPGMP